MAGNRIRSFLRSGSASPESASTVNRDQNKGVLSGLISLQDWDRLRLLLSTDVGRSAVAEELQSSGEFLSESALNFACRFHPPVDVVKAFAALSPEMLVKSGSMGRTPLHIAAKWGACPRVVRFLAESRPASAGDQDAMGKTPLHLACESYSLKYSSRKAQGRPRKEAILEVVRFLCKVSPATVNLEDNDEMTALEYAIEADLDLKVVRSLQKACEKDWKRRRNPNKNGAARKHEDLQRTLNVQQSQNGAVQKHEDAQRTLNVQQSQQPTLQQQQQRPGLDISAVSAVISSLESEKNNSSSQASVPISRPRKKTSTRALVA